ncbi:MAG: hypothetical protein D6798_06630 [Deltaproteobacteria bacterium]|nr:MAG: hypothetical protein D6798_06630 [Deltaproteobacteria bacterium]
MPSTTSSRPWSGRSTSAAPRRRLRPTPSTTGSDMTPFGIRKKLKGLVGRGGGRTDIVRYDITFVLPDGTEQTVQAEERYTLAMASQFLPAPIATGCPDGQCGGCVVDVLDDRGLAPASDSERKVFEKWHKHYDGSRRLACHARITGPGAKVRVRELFDYDSIRGTD